MKKLLQLGSTTIMGGVFFLAPLVLLIMVLSKVVTILQKITRPMMAPLERWHIGGIALHEIMAVVILVLICFAAGLLARTAAAKQLIRNLENRFLVHLPGYEVMKSVIGDQAEAPGHQEPDIVLAQTDAGWQLAFLIEPVNDDLFVIFIPNAPSLRNGSVVYAEKDKIRRVDINRKDAIRTIRRMGAGSAAVFMNKL